MNELKQFNYAIRSCEMHGDLAACVNLQNEVFGYAEHEAYPMRLFVNLSKIGGHVLGAFTPEGQLAGFVVSMPAWHGKQRYYHSLSLGVSPAHENRGLGRALKLEQRKLALRAGIDCIEWTFDPLRAKNAFFNIVRLGAVARRYLPNYYGRVLSRRQQGLPSDRLVAEWWLKSPRVRRAMRGRPPRLEQKEAAGEVRIPADFGSLVETDAAKALSLQAAVRKQLRKCFARALVITDFVRGQEAARYFLDRGKDLRCS